MWEFGISEVSLEVVSFRPAHSTLDVEPQYHHATADEFEGKDEWGRAE
ncbi:MAG: hypothetical protein U0795_12610 [Pirellulales bacterium]